MCGGGHKAAARCLEGAGQSQPSPSGTNWDHQSHSHLEGEQRVRGRWGGLVSERLQGPDGGQEGDVTWPRRHPTEEQ